MNGFSLSWNPEYRKAVVALETFIGVYFLYWFIANSVGLRSFCDKRQRGERSQAMYILLQRGIGVLFLGIPAVVVTTLLPAIRFSDLDLAPVKSVVTLYWMLGLIARLFFGAVTEDKGSAHVHHSFHSGFPSGFVYIGGTLDIDPALQRVPRRPDRGESSRMYYSMAAGRSILQRLLVQNITPPNFSDFVVDVVAGLAGSDKCPDPIIPSVQFFDQISPEKTISPR